MMWNELNEYHLGIIRKTQAELYEAKSRIKELENDNKEWAMLRDQVWLPKIRELEDQLSNFRECEASDAIISKKKNARIKELEEGLKQLELAESQAVRDHVKSLLKDTKQKEE